MDGTDTAHANLGAGTRGTGTLDHGNAGAHTLEHCINPVVGLVLQSIFRDTGDGCGYDALLLYAVTHNNHLVEHGVVQFEKDGNLAASVYVDCLSDETD